MLKVTLRVKRYSAKARGVQQRLGIFMEKKTPSWMMKGVVSLSQQGLGMSLMVSTDLASILAAWKSLARFYGIFSFQCTLRCRDVSF